MLALPLAHVARRSAGSAVHYGLSRRTGVAAAVPAAQRIDGHRGDVDAVAVPPCLDVAAHDSCQGRHRRLLGLRLPQADGRSTPDIRRFVPALELSDPALARSPAAARREGTYGI